jgi:hypothetical protein
MSLIVGLTPREEACLNAQFDKVRTYAVVGSVNVGLAR